MPVCFSADREFHIFHTPSFQCLPTYSVEIMLLFKALDQIPWICKSSHSSLSWKCSCLEEDKWGTSYLKVNSPGFTFRFLLLSSWKQVKGEKRALQLLRKSTTQSLQIQPTSVLTILNWVNSSELFKLVQPCPKKLENEGPRVWYLTYFSLQKWLVYVNLHTVL